VAYGLTLRGLKREEIKKRVDTIMDATQLSPLARRYPGELSGGQQQRVSLARALVVEPETLLLDEPLSNLDANLREEMRFEIRRLHDEFRYTTVYVTHDQAEAMTTADLIVVMNQGVVEQAGTPEDVYERPQSEFVAHFIGGANIFKGRWDGSDSVDCGHGLILRCESGEFSKQDGAAVSIRHHCIRLSTTEPDAIPTNWTRGTVARQSYLGPHRDYLVTLAGGETVRTITPVDIAIEKGRTVWLHFPPEHCRALAH
ncbi:MAG: ABC transporter ATP-binding protein, partial [Bryobacteraceae bacterium]